MQMCQKERKKMPELGEQREQKPLGFFLTTITGTKTSLESKRLGNDDYFVINSSSSVASFIVDRAHRKWNGRGIVEVNTRFSRDVTAAMLVYRTKAKKKVSGNLILLLCKDILSLFCTPTWPSHHVSVNQE